MANAAEHPVGRSGGHDCAHESLGDLPGRGRGRLDVTQQFFRLATSLEKRCKTECAVLMEICIRASRRTRGTVPKRAAGVLTRLPLLVRPSGEFGQFIVVQDDVYRRS